MLRLDDMRDVEAVDVNRLDAEPVGDLLAFDQQELLAGAVDGVEAVDAR